MHVRWCTRVTWLVVASGFSWLLILFGITMTDDLTRGWVEGTPNGKCRMANAKDVGLRLSIRPPVVLTGLCAIIDSMRQLLACRLDQRLVKALRERAASHGRSAEAEHRAILEAALCGSPDTRDFKAFLRAIPKVPQLEVRRSKDRGRPVEL